MPEYVWPLSNSTLPDVMNTSFGPRIDMDRWDFHDGIDLPAPKGTTVHAMRGGRVHRAGEAGTNRFSSRHVVIKAEDPAAGTMYHVYLHLDSIDPAVTAGGLVEQGQPIGTVGDNDATYPHLHMEMRRGTLKQIGSVHPLSFLPYPDAATFAAQTGSRFNRLDGRVAARIPFACSSKEEGDLKSVAVDLKHGASVMATRSIDLDDKTTIADSKGDEHRFTGGIAIEGYQKSNMIAHGRPDLHYGVLVRTLPKRCNRLALRITDVGGTTVASGPIVVPAIETIDEFLDFEDGLIPFGWRKLESTTGSGTMVTIDPLAAHSGDLGLLCEDDSGSESESQRAAIDFALPVGRFEWRVDAWVNPDELELSPTDSIQLLSARSGTELSVAARIQDVDGVLRAGLIARDGDGRVRTIHSTVEIEPGVWRRWRLELLRLGTRETTAVLYLDDAGRMIEQARLNWNSVGAEPDRLRAGIGYSSPGARARIFLDELWVTETELAL